MLFVFTSGYMIREYYSDSTPTNDDIVIGSDWWNDECAIEYTYIVNDKLQTFIDYTVWYKHDIVGHAPVDDRYKAWLNPEDIQDAKDNLEQNWKEKFRIMKMADKK